MVVSISAGILPKLQLPLKAKKKKERKKKPSYSLHILTYSANALVKAIKS